MLDIPVILGSTRRGRRSARVARFVISRLAARGVRTELLDLLELDFPVMEERLAYRDDPPPGLREFAQKVAAADALVLVTPEYNHGYPGVLKNALDYLFPEYRRKPFGIVTVSAGGFGGVNALEQLRDVVLAFGAYPIPAALPVSRVQQAFAEDGQPLDASYERRAQKFFDELLWLTEAVATHKAREAAEETAAVREPS